MEAPVFTHRLAKRTGYAVTGVIGLVLAGVYLALSTEYPFGTLDQPGARVWPTIVGGMVVFASLSVLWEAWRMDPAEVFELPAGANAVRVVLMIALLVGYLLALSLLGPFLAALLFTIFFMRLVSPLDWGRIVVASLAIAAVLHVIFVMGLKIPFPKGIFGP